MAANWDDWRVALAIAREGGVASAARRLKMDATTAARRLARLETALGAPLFWRDARGAARTTERGRAALSAAADLERAAIAAEDAARDAPAGMVRVTATPMIVNRILAPATAALSTAAPGVRATLIAATARLSLADCEADVAVRLARPEDGGGGVAARRVGRLDYCVCAAASLAEDAVARLPWARHGPQSADLPHAAWLADAAARSGSGDANVEVEDGEAAMAAAAGGAARAAAPRAFVDADPRLQAVAPCPIVRDLWLVRRRDQIGVARIDVVVDWVAAAVTSALKPRCSGRDGD